jgi:hypothetical protein
MDDFYAGVVEVSCCTCMRCRFEDAMPL